MLFSQALALVAVAVSCAVAAPTAAKPEKIRGVSSPIYHLYLQSHPQNASLLVLGPEATGETFNIGASIQSTKSNLYINIENDSTSYKTLTLGKNPTTTAWGLEGDTIITTQKSSYGRQLNFVVCALSGGYYQPYLQTGSQTPAGKSCSNYLTLHLPCLC